MVAGIEGGLMLPQVPERTVFRDNGDSRRISTEWPRGGGYIHLSAAGIGALLFIAMCFEILTEPPDIVDGILLLANFTFMVGFVYWGLAGVFNWTDIHIQDDGIIIRTGPIPWRRDMSISRIALRQLYVQKDRRIWNSEDTDFRPEYQVRAMIAEGVSLKVIGRLTTKEQGWFIERQIEDYYGIDDRPVAEEIPKGRR